MLDTMNMQDKPLPPEFLQRYRALNEVLRSAMSRDAVLVCPNCDGQPCRDCLKADLVFQEWLAQ
jgi:hypothetical protein